jgi:hypothetical protein
VIGRSYSDGTILSSWQIIKSSPMMQSSPLGAWILEELQDIRSKKKDIIFIKIIITN